MPTLDASWFQRRINGRYGTFVFGSGVTALTGRITESATDHVVITMAGDNRTYVIPLSSILYFREEQERGR